MQHLAPNPEAASPPRGFGNICWPALSPSSEVVTLTTRDAGGAEHATPLWVVEDQGGLWIRAGNPENAWLKRLQADSTVQLERGGETLSYHALPSDAPDAQSRVNTLMAEKYGASDTAMQLFNTNDVFVPVLLKPQTDVASGNARTGSR